MSELQEIRRYWPRAKLHGELLVDGVSIVRSYRINRDWRLCCEVRANGASVSRYPGCVVSVGTSIAAAMRAAGFGLRPLGKFARATQKWSKVRAETLRAWGFASQITIKPVRLTNRQRPRKSARLGKRKRREAA